MGGIEDIVCGEPTPENTAKLREGREMYNAGNYDGALRLLGELLVELPFPHGNSHAADAHTYRAFCFLKTGDVERGKRELGFAVQMFASRSKDNGLYICWKTKLDGFFEENPKLDHLKPKNL